MAKNVFKNYSAEKTEEVLEPFRFGHVIPSRAGNTADGLFVLNQHKQQSTEGVTVTTPMLFERKNDSKTGPTPIETSWLDNKDLISESNEIPAKVNRQILAEVANNAWDQKRTSSINWLKESLFGFNSDPEFKHPSQNCDYQRKMMMAQINLFVMENKEKDFLEV